MTLSEGKLLLMLDDSSPDEKLPLDLPVVPVFTLESEQMNHMFDKHHHLIMSPYMLNTTSCFISWYGDTQWQLVEWFYSMKITGLRSIPS